MEFSYTNFNGRLILNPNDFILRFEEKENYRIYERIFLDRDFVEYLAIGGINFVSAAISLLFSDSDKAKSNGLIIKDFTSNSNMIAFKLVYTNAVIVDPIVIPFQICAIRKEDAGVDLEDVNRRMKSLMSSFEKRMLEMESKVLELTERCGDSITISGCEYAIPIHTTTLKLVRNNCGDWDNHFYSCIFPHKNFCVPDGNKFTNQASSTTWQWVQNGTITLYDSPFTYSILNTNVKICLKNIKYLKNCQWLMLCGLSVIQDYSAIGNLTELQTLIICSSRETSNPIRANQQVEHSNDCQLKDISWIRNLKKLTTVKFMGCSQLTDITPLKDLPNLTTLDIRGTGVKNSDFLTNGKLTITK